MAFNPFPVTPQFDLPFVSADAVDRVAISAAMRPPRADADCHAIGNPDSARFSARTAFHVQYGETHARCWWLSFRMVPSTGIAGLAGHTTAAIPIVPRAFQSCRSFCRNGIWQADSWQGCLSKPPLTEARHAIPPQTHPVSRSSLHSPCRQANREQHCPLHQG